MKGWPLRWRLTAWYAVSLIVLLSVFGGVVDALMHQRLLSRTDFELDEELHELVQEINLTPERNAVAQQLDLRFGHHKTFESRVLTEAGKTLYESRGLIGAAATVPSPPESLQFHRAELPQLGPVRIATQQVATRHGNFVVQVIMPLKIYLTELRDLRRLMFAVGPLMAFVSIAGGYWLARRSLAPVDRMTQTAAQITARDLAERLEVANPHDELGRLATTFNALLDRLQRSFEELQRFTADAAHEFRTPLAVIRTSLEVASRHRRSTAYYQECLHGIREENERLTSLANQLLLLAREDAGLNDSVLEQINLAALLEQVAADLEPLSEEKSVTICCDLDAEAWIAADAPALRRVFLNVLDNAIKAAPTAGEVFIQLARREERAVTLLSDNGPGISPDHLPHIFDRFYRVDASRARENGGAGLGLAISRAIVHRHGGEISICESIQRGATIRVVLPLTMLPNVIQLSSSVLGQNVQTSVQSSHAVLANTWTPIR